MFIYRIKKFIRSPNYLPVLTSILVMYYFYHSFLLASPVIQGDLVVPYPNSVLNSLSAFAPWYSLASAFFYTYFFSIYGFLFNSSQLFLFIPAYFTMYFLLREMKIRNKVSVPLSLFYIFNPVVFSMVYSYNNLMWPEFYIVAPILILFLFRYYNYERTLDIVLFSVILSFYLEIQTAPTLYNIRLLIPILGITYLITFIHGIRKGTIGQILKGYGLSILLIMGLNILPIISMLGYSSYAISLANVSNSSFLSFHMGNLLYTYQSQNILFSISGLVVYPRGTNSLLLGYGQVFFLVTIVFDLLVVIAVISPLIIFRKHSGFIKSLSLASILIWVFIVGVSSHVFVPLFIRYPFLFLWEYPSYLEMILVVPYTLLISLLLTDIWTVHTREMKRTQRSRKSFGVASVFSFLRGNSNKLIFVVVIIILFSYFVPVAYTNPTGYASPAAGSIQSPIYHDIHNFFKDKNGEYKIMIVPFNDTDYREISSAISSCQVFSLPYAYQNNPSAFSNATLFKAVYSDMETGNMYNFSTLLNYTSVKYIITIDSGTTSTELNSLSSLPYLSVAYSSDGFTIYQNTKFHAANVISNPVIYSECNAHSINNYSVQIGHNTNFTNISGYTSTYPYVPYWGEWSSNLGYNYAFNFSKNYARVSVYGNSSEPSAQLSEIIQRVPVTPGSLLNLTVNVLAQNNSYSRIFIIAHSINSNNLFSSHQYYFRIPEHQTGNFSMEAQMPWNTEYVDFGVMVWNYTAGNGGLTVSSLKTEQVNGLNSSDYSSNVQQELPLNTITYPGNLSGLEGYKTIKPVIPGEGILYIPSGNWSYIQGVGIGILNSNLTFNVPAGYNILASIEPLSNGSVVYNNTTYNSTMLNLDIPSSDVTSSNIIQVHGSAIINYIGAEKNIPSSNSTSGNVRVQINSYTVTVYNNGGEKLIVMYSPFPGTYTLTGNVSLLTTQTSHGVKEQLYLLGTGGNVTLTFKKPSINLPIIVFNLSSMILMLSIIFYYSVLWAHKRRKSKLLDSQPPDNEIQM